MKGQLDLFRADAEALRCLREELDGVLAAHEALFDRYAALRRQLATTEQQCRRWQDQEEYWHAQATFWEQFRAAIPRTPGPAPSTAPPLELDQALKRLLTLCHPDKWSQGQPASELAHELAVAVNAVRAHVEGQP